MKNCNQKICPHWDITKEFYCNRSSTFLAMYLQRCKLRLVFQRLHRAYLKDESATGLNSQWAKEYYK